MTRTLTFVSTADDNPLVPSEEKKRFALLVNLFIAGGNLLHFDPQRGQLSRSKEDRRGEAMFVRAYKAISDELPDNQRRLKLEGGTLALDQSTFVLLEKYLAAAPGATQDADIISDLLDWVSAADKTD